MFRRQVVIGLSLLLLIGGAATYSVMQVRDEDRERYDYLVDRSVNGAAPDEVVTSQLREGVVKEMWMSTEPSRLQIRLTSESSELLIPDAIEQMEEVTGYMQEELFYLLPDGRRAHRAQGCLFRVSGESYMQLPGDDWVAMQEIRYLQAAKASFDYTAHRFLAHDVTMIRFEATGHDLPESFDQIDPVMSGTASWVEFTLDGDRLDFQAHQLRAKIFSEERLI